MNFGQPTILFTGNTPELFGEVKPILSEEYNLLHLTGGREVLETAWDCLPDLILLEDKLPDINSAEVCAQLTVNTHTHNIPVIILSSSADDVNLACLQAGAVDYINCTIQPEILRARVRVWMELKHYRDQFAGLEFIHLLTGIPNRRMLNEQFHREWRRAIRTQTPLSLLIIGVDFFTELKEYYGQQAADDCLRQFSRALIKSVKRETDYIMVYGEAEFILLLPETDECGALKVAQRFQVVLEELNNAHEGAPGAARFNTAQITTSMGVATVIPTPKRSPDYLFQQAAALLSEARRDGYNQIRYLALSTA